MSSPPSTTANQDDWLDEPSSNTNGTRIMADREWASIDERFTNDGYREGIPEGKLSTLQAGFDNGFTLSAPLARQLGSLRAQSSSLLALLNPPPSLRPKLPSLPSVSPSLSEEITQDVKALIRELSGVRMVDIVGRDREAEEHSKEHGIEIPEEDRQEGDDEDGERKIGEWKKQLQGLREKAGLFPIRMNR